MKVCKSAGGSDNLDNRFSSQDSVKMPLSDPTDLLRFDYLAKRMISISKRPTDEDHKGEIKKLGIFDFKTSPNTPYRSLTGLSEPTIDNTQ
jgi:hypothetical protein